ncbi:MAG: type II secretion system protein [Chthoniobacteraceae bacterium]
MKLPSIYRPRLAFTLVELLVVIAIIVILMSLLLTAVPAVKKAAQKTEARNTCNHIVSGLKSYYNEYGKFPPTEDPSKETTSAVVTDTIVGDTTSGATLPNNTVFYTLRNIPKGPNQDYVSNPRKLPFYEGKSGNVNAAGVVRGGFYDRSANGSTPPSTEESCLYDPWGRQFFVILDANSDGRIDLDGYYNDFSGVDDSGKAPRTQVGAFSMGPDEKLGNKGDRTYRNGSELSDDVVSWE